MSEEKPPVVEKTPHEQVMEAQRLIYAKLQQLEKKLDVLLGPADGPQGDLGLKGRKGRKPPNPQHMLLQGRLISEWFRGMGSKYVFSPRDARAISQLLKRGQSMDELIGRWAYAFKHGSTSIFDFEMNFNKYAPSLQSNRPQVAGSTDLYKETPK